MTQDEIREKILQDCKRLQLEPLEVYFHGNIYVTEGFVISVPAALHVYTEDGVLKGKISVNENLTDPERVEEEIGVQMLQYSFEDMLFHGKLLHHKPEPGDGQSDEGFTMTSYQ
ncbi:MAG: hypothetical protein ACI4D7_01060 [Lachnospiraceae bacterium]